MAGTLPGLAIVPNPDNNNELMRGCLLRIYEAGTSVAVTAYKDVGLTPGQEHPWPIVGDSNSRLPMFWLPNGNYRARLSDAENAFVAYDIQNFPTVSDASSGSGGGGGGGGVVDETRIFQVGDADWQPRSGERVGWVRHNGRTIGNVGSAATERSNTDTSALYAILWERYDDTICPVTGGRGANAAADFAALKPIQLLDMRFIMPIGMDTMGNLSAGRATGVPVVSGAATNPASVLGEARHTITTAEVGQHDHGQTTDDTPEHTHPYGATASTANILYSTGVNALNNIMIGPQQGPTGGASTRHKHSVNANAAAAAHNNTPLAMTGTWYVKL